MRRKTIAAVAAVALIISISFQSCIGSFSLTNKVLSWNRSVSNKFVNELVFFAFWVLPVYEVTAAADLLVINSIEFWSGNNPLEANNKVIKTDDGDYRIMANQNGYKILSPSGETIAFEFDADTQTWSFLPSSGEKIDFLQFKDDNHVNILGKDGNFVDVELSDEGVSNYLLNLGAPLYALR